MNGSSATRISVILVNAADTVKEVEVTTKLSVGATFCNSEKDIIEDEDEDDDDDDDDDDELLCSTPSKAFALELFKLVDFLVVNCKADPFSLSKHFVNIDESLILNILELETSSSSSSTSFGGLKPLLPLSVLFSPSLSSLL